MPNVGGGSPPGASSYVDLFSTVTTLDFLAAADQDLSTTGSYTVEGITVLAVNENGAAAATLEVEARGLVADVLVAFNNPRAKILIGGAGGMIPDWDVTTHVRIWLRLGHTTLADACRTYIGYDSNAGGDEAMHMYFDGDPGAIIAHMANQTDDDSASVAASNTMKETILIEAFGGFAKFSWGNTAWNGNEPPDPSAFTLLGITAARSAVAATPGTVWSAGPYLTFQASFGVHTDILECVVAQVLT